MCNILLSINPEHVENIFSGIKKYEYRKIKCKQDINKIIIYSTFPVMKVVGEATVECVLENSPIQIWLQTKSYSGINFNFFNEYYKGRDKAVAYKLTDVIKYDNPKELNNFGIHAAPQSFVYV